MTWLFGANFQVGFNAGNGTKAYEYKPYSQDMRIRDLAYKGWANKMPGRHIFRLDEKVMSGNCFDDECIWIYQNLRINHDFNALF